MLPAVYLNLAFQGLQPLCWGYDRDVPSVKFGKPNRLYNPRIFAKQLVSSKTFTHSVNKERGFLEENFSLVQGVDNGDSEAVAHAGVKEW